jgi:hypothetical protein
MTVTYQFLLEGNLTLQEVQSLILKIGNLINEIRDQNSLFVEIAFNKLREFKERIEQFEETEKTLTENLSTN